MKWRRIMEEGGEGAATEEEEEGRREKRGKNQPRVKTVGSLPSYAVPNPLSLSSP